jgi:hypothetical protein
LKWLGVSAVFVEGGFEHLIMFKGLVAVGKTIRERLGVIWVSIISSIWNARNAMIFKQAAINWEKVADEYKVLCWKIIRSRSTSFNFPLSHWLANPLDSLGVHRFL